MAAAAGIVTAIFTVAAAQDARDIDSDPFGEIRHKFLFDRK
jgi:hypothetical protein